MRRVTIPDIRKRQNSLNRLQYQKPFICKNIEENFNKKYNFQQAKILLEHWTNLASNTEVAFEKSLNILESIYENGTEGEFNFAKNYILENIVSTVRDGSQAANYVKMRTRRFKSKIGTKITNKVDALKNAVKNSNEENKKKLDVTTATTPEKMQEALSEIQESLNVYIQCDRVLKNNKILCNRFNINSIISECYSIYDIYDSIHTLCEFVDTYDIPFKMKYNVALEQINYNLEKAGFDFDKAEMINEITDYFLCRDIIEEYIIDDMKYILSNNKFFTESDLNLVKYIFGEDKKPEAISEFAELDSYIEESKIDEVKKIINNYKLQKEMKPEDLRGIISKIYTKSADNIIDDMPSILSWIRFAFVLSTFQINAVVGIISVIVDQFIKLHLSRKETSRMITSFENERKAVLSKLKKTKDKEIISRLKEYDNKLEYGLKKLKEYSNNLLSDKEKEELDSKDLDFDLETANVASMLSYISESYDNLYTHSDISNIIESTLKNHLKDLSLDDIDLFTEFYTIFPESIDKNKLLECFTMEIDRAKDELFGYDKWDRYNCIKENMQTIINTTPSKINIDNISFEESVLKLNAMTKMINTCKDINEFGVINESITSSLKLAMNKLKKAAVKLSDKEKSMSRTIDASLNTLARSMERAVRNDNREAIIRGSVIPSASKIIKGAIVTGAIAFVNPAVAAIGALGALATSKKMKYKERQLILDEIEIELKMCERYLRQAEDNNDLEAQKQILTTQRSLERQKQRIKYKMTVYYNQNVPDIKKDDD